MYNGNYEISIAKMYKHFPRVKKRKISILNERQNQIIFRNFDRFIDSTFSQFLFENFNISAFTRGNNATTKNARNKQP